MAIDRACPTQKFARVYVVVDNYRIHTAKARGRVAGSTPALELMSCRVTARGRSVERAFGDGHDKCTRNHKRTRIAELVSDVVWHLKGDGPWRYRLSEIYYAPEVDRAMADLIAAEELKAA